jgi:hypothetical protein
MLLDLYGKSVIVLISRKQDEMKVLRRKKS